MIERLWRSVKYEYIYLNAFETGSEMRAGTSKWLAYYNSGCPHSTHGISPPYEAYASKTETSRPNETLIHLNRAANWLKKHDQLSRGPTTAIRQARL
jgi:hypothetical protein